MKVPPWSADECASLVDLIEMGATFALAGRALGRTPEAAQAMWQAICTDPACGPGMADRIVVPQERWDERSRRLSASHRDLAGACLGDPRLGYSALDRRAEAAPRRCEEETP